MSPAMSVSDESNGSLKPKPKRKVQVNLTKDQWHQARIQYESGELSLPKLAALYHVSLSTMEHKSADNKWTKGKEIVLHARRKLQEATDNALTVAAAQAAERITSNLNSRP